VADSTLRSKVTRLKRGATFLLFDAFHRAAWAFCPLLKKKLLNFPGTSAWLPSGCPSGTKGRKPFYHRSASILAPTG
jgi:hypothetical protein